MEKELDLMRLHYLTAMQQFRNQISNLQEQLDYNQQTIVEDQLKLDRDLLLHYHELQLLDTELIKMKS